MPYVGLVLSTLAIWLIYWFVHMGGMDRAADFLSIRRNSKRREAALAKERVAPIAALVDPRDAALVLMLLIARDASAPTREQYAAIEGKARSVFAFDKELPERMAHARFVAARADSFEQAAGMLSGLLRSHLIENECRELIEMIESIAAYDGPSDAQREAIDGFRRRLGPT
jgi:hypothetical protein